MHRARRWTAAIVLAALAALAALAGAPGCGGTAPADGTVRVMLDGDAPAGTQRLYAALTLSRDLCESGQQELCAQIWQVELPPPGGDAFDLTLPDDLREARQNVALHAGIDVRVEARGADGCMLARGTQSIAADKNTARVALAATSGELCSLWIAVLGPKGAAVKYGAGSVCPPARPAYSFGALCLVERRRGEAVPLQATLDTIVPQIERFDGWEGFAGCARAVDCTIPPVADSGAIVVRARYRWY